MADPDFAVARPDRRWAALVGGAVSLRAEPAARAVEMGVARAVIAVPPLAAGVSRILGLRGVVILLTWLYLSSFVALLGAGINAAPKRQPRRDTTPAPPKNMGERGAYAPDTLGDAVP